MFKQLLPLCFLLCAHSSPVLYEVPAHSVPAPLVTVPPVSAPQVINSAMKQVSEDSLVLASSFWGDIKNFFRYFKVYTKGRLFTQGNSEAMNETASAGFELDTHAGDLGVDLFHEKKDNGQVKDILGVGYRLDKSNSNFDLGLETDLNTMDSFFDWNIDHIFG